MRGTSAASLLLVLAACLPGAGCTLVPALTGPPQPLAPASPGIGPPSSGTVVRGVVHCHSLLSHDSQGSFAHIAEQARQGQVSFVALTDHYKGHGQLAGQVVPTELDGVLFLPGIEVPAAHGSLLGIDVPQGFDEELLRGVPQPEIDALNAAGALTFIGHAEGYVGWDATGYTGLEVANLHAMALTAPLLGTAASFLFDFPGSFLRRLVRHLDRRVLARWDWLGRSRRVPGIGGCDAHENLHLPIGGPDISTYGECFRAVTTHLLVRSPGAAGVREALAAGRGYVAFELLGSALGFRYALFDPQAGALLADMGEELPWRAGLELRAAAPGGATLYLLRDGQVLASGAGRLTCQPPGPGVYRVEAYLGRDPFVLSNPIYLR